jgi:FtsP/CotA-like multicopper oxidase with cupredoxin domain
MQSSRALLALLVSPTVSLVFAADVCPRPAIGSVVPTPAALYSASGKLSVDFHFRSAIDIYGLPVYCYIENDGTQAPTLRVNPSDELVLTLKNELTPESSAPKGHVHSAAASTPQACSGGAMTKSSTNLHFHGLNIPPKCHQDEVIHTAIQPSQDAFEYRIQIPQSQKPGLYWYHPHPHGFSEEQVLGGASGALIVEGIEKMMPEVGGLPERVLVLRDTRVPGLAEAAQDAGPGKNISLNFVPVMFPLYRPAEMLVKPGQREFWRVLNASADTIFDLQVLTGERIQDVHTPQPLKLIAMDGVPIDPAAPASVSLRESVLLTPGGRAEFIVTTPPAGTIGQVVTRQYDTGAFGSAIPRRTLANLRVSPAAPTAPSTVPKAPNSASARFEGLLHAKPAAQRKLYFSEMGTDPADPNATPVYFLTVDGAQPKAFDMNFQHADITVRQGTVEDWVIENRAREAHTFHIHQLHFQVLERDGVLVQEPMLRDTIDVPYWDGQEGKYPTVKLRMDFRDPQIVGTFLYHCHILEHEDAGMMGSITVKPAL